MVLQHKPHIVIIRARFEMTTMTDKKKIWLQYDECLLALTNCDYIKRRYMS